MESPLVSIIVPVFNMEQYISECIESIQKQTYQNLQIILVDDGSVDRSGEICDAYAAADHRIEVVHQQNEGPVKARKCGLERAEGKYVGFVDGDDYIALDMYQMLVKELEATRADFVHSGYWENNSKKIVPIRNVIDVSLNKISFMEGATLGQDGYITPSIWSKLFQADFIRKSFEKLPDDCILGEDVLVLCICVLESKRIALMDRADYHYRVREKSLSHQNHINDLKNVIKLHHNLCQILRQYGLDKDSEHMMDEFLWNHLLEYMGRIAAHDFQIARYCFNNTDKLNGKRVVIYGAGAVGRDYYAQISRYSDCRIVAWTDANPEKYHYSNVRLYRPETLCSMTFDILIIAVWEEASAKEIQFRLTENGVEQCKIFWSKPGRLSFKNAETK